MKEIITVTGKINPDELGFCQAHEHVAMRRGKFTEFNSDLCIDDFEKSLREVNNYRLAGGGAFIEAQPTGCGRDVAWLRDISRQTGVKIIASTGFHKLSFYPSYHWIWTASEKTLKELFLRELSEGMCTDGDHYALPEAYLKVKAGIIKTAYDSEQLTPIYQKLFRAAAYASRKADRIIMIHVENGTDPTVLQDFLMNIGVPARNLMFCHMDRACLNQDMHRKILINGSYLEYDTIGRFKYHSDQEEINLIRQRISEGFEDYILYSLDTTRARLKEYDSKAVGLTYILKKFNGELQESGISFDQIHKFSHDNVVNLLMG